MSSPATNPNDFYNTTASSWHGFFLYSGIEPVPKIETPKVIFFDVESTGLDVDEDKIVDLCLCIRQDGREEWRDSLIDPEQEIPPDATKIHGIDDTMIADARARGKAPTFGQVAQRLRERFEGACVIGHNIDEYDVPILQAHFRRAGIIWKPTQTIDTIRLYRQRFPGRKAGLQAIARSHNFRQRSAHRARPDVETTIDVFNLILGISPTSSAGI
jgi:DNA polymerase-3 subunit epsilon